MKRIFFVLVAVLMLLACGSKEKDAEYYTNHPEEMKQKMEECNKLSAAEDMADMECAAAMQADSHRFFKSTVERTGEGKGRGTKQY